MNETSEPKIVITLSEIKEEIEMLTGMLAGAERKLADAQKEYRLYHNAGTEYDLMEAKDGVGWYKGELNTWGNLYHKCLGRD